MKRRQYNAVSRSYAQALFNAGKSKGVLDAMENEVKDLSSILAKNERLKTFLAGPQFSTEAKHEMLVKVFGDRMNPMIIRVMELTVARDRFFEIDAIFELFLELAEEERGVFPASFVSATDLNSDEKKKLQASLEKYTQCQLDIQWETDSHLIGGAVFRFRDLMIDSSLRGKLNGLKKKFKDTKLKGQAA